MYIMNRNDSRFNIAKIEEKYGGAKFMGMWCLKTKSGGWSETPAHIFYQPNPDTSLGHTHYFGLFERGGVLYITKGDSAFSNLYGILADDGEVLVSRYRHYYTRSEDGTVWIDGGRDYTRHGGGTVLEVNVRDGNFYVDDGLLERRGNYQWQL